MSFPIKKNGGDGKKWKRKRTQRHCNINSLSQPPPAPASTSSASSSAEFSGLTTEEEEIELANSLILLSRGGNLKDQTTAAVAAQSDTPTSPAPPPIKTEKTDTKSTSLPDGSFQCKTCNKSFPSFQALGGHRASHKKPKLTLEEQKVQIITTDAGTTDRAFKKEDINYRDEIEIQADYSALVKSHVLTVGSKTRVHGCQICKAEFASGQALGGHMRKHKPLNGGDEAVRSKKERSGLELDLNLPPSDQEETVQHQPPVFPPATELLLGNSALTNCLY